MKSTGTIFLAAGLAVACAAQAYADAYDPTTLTAATIFQRARAAYGTRQPGTSKEVDLIVGGGVTQTRTTLSDGTDTVTTVQDGDFTSAYGIYHKQNWVQNDNGVVTLESNFRLKVDPNDLALQHPEDPKYNVRVLGITQNEPKEFVVELNPADGFDQLRYYDAQTFLLDRIVSFTRDRHRHVVEFGDYRKSFGVMRAFTMHSYDGRPQNDRTTTIESIEPVSGTADLSMPASKALFTDDASKPILLPARFTRQGIILRTDVGGRGLDFLLDSGASGLFIDPGIAHQLGLSAYGHSTETIGGGDVDMGRVRIPAMTIGQLKLDDVVFHTSPFDEEAGGARVVGLIGFDFFASGIIGIDFKAQTVTLYPRAQFQPSALGLRALPLQLDDGVPRTDAWVEGVHGHFLVDTGAFSLLIYHDFAQKLPTVATETNQAAIGTVGGTMPASVIDLRDLVFGGVRFEAAQAQEPATSTFDIEDYDGIIGRDVLATYASYFDYDDGYLYVKPNL